jgi:hypothetical protein
MQPHVPGLPYRMAGDNVEWVEFAGHRVTLERQVLPRQPCELCLRTPSVLVVRVWWTNRSGQLAAFEPSEVHGFCATHGAEAHAHCAKLQHQYVTLAGGGTDG